MTLADHAAARGDYAIQATALTQLVWALGSSGDLVRASQIGQQVESALELMRLRAAEWVVQFLLVNHLV